MANYEKIIKVDIAVNTSASLREGFGIPLFITAHREFSERVRIYTDLSGIAADFDTASNAYAAGQSAFSQSPSVAQFYIGRREADSVISIPVTPEAADSYTLSVTTATTTSVASYTATGGDTEEVVLQDLLNDLEAEIGSTGSAEVTLTLSGTGAGATLSIVDTDAEVSFHTAVSNDALLSIGLTSTETPADIINAVSTENDAYYFVTAEDHTDAFVTAMAMEIEARKKVYFWSTSDAAELSGSGTGLTLSMSEYDRSFGYFHHEAETRFPELAYVSFNAPWDAGSVTWANLQLSGIGASQSAGGNLLTATQKNNLTTANMNFSETEAGLTFTRTGTCASGEWIDTIRGVDWLDAEMTASLRDLLVNQAGGKITHDDVGYTQVKSVMDGVLQQAVQRNFLNSYTSSVPLAANVSFADKASRILRDVTFVGNLSGAVHTIAVTGEVTYNS